jgi:hypothetical protein
MKKILALTFNLFMGAILAFTVGGGAFAAVGIGAVLSLAPKMTGVLPVTAGIQVHIWENDIIEGLWADNQFLNFAFNADQYVLQGKVVHIPQAGAPPNVEVNRATLPAKVTQRTDVDVTYAIDEITSDPVHIPNADTIELSYDKRTSVTSETRAAMYEAAALNMLFRWSPTDASRIAKTSGEPAPVHLDGATGNRRIITLKDIKAAQTKFNTDNVPVPGRYIMLDAEMYNQITNEMSANEQRDFLAAYNEKDGILGRIYGFNVLMRSQVMRYTGGGSPKNWATGAAATDCAAALVWQRNSLERALGGARFFEDLGNPQWYGDIYSSLLRLGGRIRRKDGKGVLAIVQDAAA